MCAAEQILSAPNPGPAPAIPAAAHQATDVAAQLKTLAELHAGGALSDDEFASAKARLLS